MSSAVHYTLLGVLIGAALVALLIDPIFTYFFPREDPPDTARLKFVNDNHLVLMRGFGMWVVMHDGGNGPLLPVSLPHPTVRAAIDAVMADGIVPVVLPDAA